MPRCNCGAGTCACSVTPGVGISIKGNGSTAAPYEITNTQGSLGQQLLPSDTETVDLALTPSNPDNLTGSWVLTADATVALTDLTDVREDQTVVEGDVPVWRGDHWEFEQAGSGALPPGGDDGDVLTRTSALTAVNLIPNPRFAGTPLATLPVGYRWTPSRCTIAADPAVKRHDTGPQSVACTVTAADGAAYITSGAASAGGYLPITPGAVLTTMFSVFPGAGAGGTYFTSVYFFDAAGAAVGSPFGSTAVTCPENEWTDLRETFPAAPAGATQIRVAIGSAIGLTLGSVFWMAEPLTVVGTYGDPYFDGESLDDGAYTFAWSGTADQSASNRTSLLAVWEEVDGLPPGGTDGQVLTKQSTTDGDADWETPAAGGGGVVMEPPIRAAYWRSAALASVISTTALVWDTAERTAEGITYNSSTGDFTVATTGWYLITSRLRLVSTSATGQATQFRLMVNGLIHDFTADNITTAPSSMVLSRQVYLNAADIITMHLSSGGAGVSLSTSTSKANSVEVSRLDLGPVPGGGGVVVERPIATSRQHATAIPAVASAANVTVPWDTAQADDGSIPCSSGVFTIPVTGWYQVNVKVTFPFNATGQRSVRVLRNGASADMGVVQIAPVPVANATTVQYARALKLTAGDTILVNASQSSGGALDVAYGGISYNSVDITKMPQSFSGSAVSTYGERNYSTSRRQAAVVPAANNTQVVIPWDTLDHADGITCDAAGIFTFPVAGYYQVNAKVAFASNTTGKREIRALLNGSSAVPGIVLIPPVASASGTNVQFSRLLKVAAGDTLQIGATQTSGVTLDAASAGVAYNSIDITKVPAPVINGAAASGVWGVAPLDAYGTDSLVGLPVYIDTAGQLRAEPRLIPSKLPTVLGPAYPTGTSVMYLASVDGAAGWPTNGNGIVVTHRTANNVIVQQCSPFTAVSTKMWVRNGTSTGWSPWVLVADSATPHVARNKTVAQNLAAASTYYTVIFEEEDTPGAGITYSNGVFTVPTDGLYQLDFALLAAGVAATQMRVSITTTNPSEGAVNRGAPAWNGQGTSMLTWSRAFRMKAGATLIIQAYAGATGQSITGSTTNYSTMSLTRVAS